MNKNFFAILLTVLALVIVLSACGKKTENTDKETDTEAATTTENVTASESKEPKIMYSMKIGDTDISEFTIVVPTTEDDVANTLALHITEEINNLTGIELKTVKDETTMTEHEIVIGNTSRRTIHLKDNDTFGIECSGGNVYMYYSNSISAYQAVISTLNDNFFDIELAKNDVITLTSDFVYTGKCSEYLIGDNEFNPFQ